MCESQRQKKISKGQETDARKVTEEVNEILSKSAIWYGAW